MGMGCQWPVGYLKPCRWQMNVELARIPKPFEHAALGDQAGPSRPNGQWASSFVYRLCFTVFDAPLLHERAGKRPSPWPRYKSYRFPSLRQGAITILQGQGSETRYRSGRSQPGCNHSVSGDEKPDDPTPRIDWRRAGVAQCPSKYLFCGGCPILQSCQPTAGGSKWG